MTGLVEMFGPRVPVPVPAPKALADMPPPLLPTNVELVPRLGGEASKLKRMRDDLGIPDDFAEAGGIDRGMPSDFEEAGRIVK